MQAIVMGDSFEHKFKPMSQERPKSLFPLVNVPLLFYTLEFLAHNNVNQVILVTTHESRVFKNACNIIKEAHMVGNMKRLEII